MKTFDSSSASAPVDHAVEDEDAAVRRDRIGGERRLVGLEQRSADGRAARVVVLDDDRRRQLELLDQPARRVEVEQVVERQLLAVQLRHHRQQVRARAGLRVVGGALVRVLAVRQVEHLLVHARVERREVVLALGEPARDRGVVARGVGERLGRQRLARRARTGGPRPSAAPRARRRSYSGVTTTAANGWFFAAARISVGPPMSMFSMTSSYSAPRAAAVRSNG